MSARDAVRHYLGKIDREYRPGTGTEHTYRPMLKELLEALIPNLTATNEPKRVACGAPDFVVARTEHHGPLTIGYVEAKDIGVPLGEMEHSDQLKRYRASLANLVLTDYLEFRWYVNGEPRLRARLATVGAGRKLVHEPAAATDHVIELLQGFLTHSPEPIRSPQELAARMARLAHIIRGLTFSTLQVDKPGDDGRPAVDAQMLRAIQPALRTLVGQPTNRLP